MTRLTVLRLLTALALLLGQWSLLAHAGEHTVDSAHDALCVVCLQGQSLEQMQTTGGSQFYVTPVGYAVSTPGSRQAVTAPRLKPSIRGPPALP